MEVVEYKELTYTSVHLVLIPRTLISILKCSFCGNIHVGYYFKCDADSCGFKICGMCKAELQAPLVCKCNSLIHDRVDVSIVSIIGDCIFPCPYCKVDLMGKELQNHFAVCNFRRAIKATKRSHGISDFDEEPPQKKVTTEKGSSPNPN